MATGVASAGTMVAAVLETAGYHYQSFILDNFTSAFQGSLGGFVYLVGVAVTIFAVAIRGGYRYGPWLLIGPPLFFSAVLPRTDVNFVTWKFAQQDRNNARVAREVDRVLDGNNQPARVSTLFAKYTKLVSGTTQEMVKVINNKKTETDKWFILKGQLLSRFYARNAENPGLQQLIQYGLLRLCGEKVAAAKIVRDLRLPERERKAADEEMQRYDKDRYKITSREAAQAIADIRMSSGNLGANQRTDVNDILENELFTCKDIWFYVYKGLLREGKLTVDRAQSDAVINDIDKSKFNFEMAKALGLVDSDSADTGAIDDARILQDLAFSSAKFILRNESARNSFAGRLEETAGLSREYDSVEAPVENQLAQTELARGRSTEWAEKTRLMTAASNLPYFQGLLLYFLSIAFPFFAMLLLVPGKHGAFLMWFILWLWVKSWDVAMAIVMQLDDILFTLLSLSQKFHQDPLQVAKLQDDFQLAILALRESDPTFQMTTYYNIIAASLLAIPIVTSQLILGSLNGGAGLISAGMRSMTDLGAQGAERTQSQPGISNNRHMHQQLAMDQMKMYFRNRLGLGPVHADPKTGRPTRSRFDFATLAEAPGQPGKFTSRNNGTHIEYGPSTPYIASNRYGDQAGFTLGDKQRLANAYAFFQGAIGSANRPGTNRRLRNTLMAHGVPSTKVSSVIRELTAAMGSGGEKGLESFATYLNSTAGAEVKTVAAWAEQNAAYSTAAKQFAASARGDFTQLEVPWTPNATGEAAESEMEVTFMKNQHALKAGVIEAFGSAADKGIGAFWAKPPDSTGTEENDHQAIADNLSSSND